MTWTIAWTLLKRFWWAIPLAGLAIALLISRGDARHNLKLYEAEKAAHALDLANVKAVTAKAVADNIADMRAKESDAAAITEDKQNDLTKQLADARASAAAYSSRMRCPASTSAGNASSPGIGQTAGATGESSGTGGSAVVPEHDLEICAVNTTKAKGWQDWYLQLRARYNAATTP